MALSNYCSGPRLQNSSIAGIIPQINMETCHQRPSRLMTSP
uniref:Uncharacterized protein n=1 Tax=Strigamia maritima TaxID=126957 RepID=T1IMC4_STRMM